VRRRYKINQLMVNVLPDPGGGPFPCRAPSLPDCLDITLQQCPGNTLIACGGATACLHMSQCMNVTLLDCGVSLVGAGSCEEACISCSGCSLEPSCGLTRISHPAVCSAAHLEGLAVLRTQLNQMMAQLDEREAAIESMNKPESVDEVEALEGRLNAALATLAEWKAELDKGKGA
jgi:hypothetical protein